MSNLRAKIASTKRPLEKERTFRIRWERLQDDGSFEEFEEELTTKGDGYSNALQIAYDRAYGLADKHPFKIDELFRNGWVKVADLYSNFERLK